MNPFTSRERHPSPRRRGYSPWAAGLTLTLLMTGAAFASPPADRDHDGVADRQDLCRATPQGAALVGSGCSALDLVLTPEGIVDPVRSRLDEQAAAIEADPAFAEAGRALREGSRDLAKAADVMRGGEVCRAADLFDAAVSGLQAGERTFEDALRAETPRRLGAPDPRTGLPAGALSVALPRVHQSLAHQAVERARAAAGLMRAACGQVAGSGPLRGQVTRVDDASRTFRLDGQLAGIAAGPLPAGLIPGRTLDGRGVRFADGTALLTSLRNGLPAAAPALKTTPCLSAEVAPFQFFPPYKTGTSPYRLRDRNAYVQGMYGILVLERVQRLAAQAPSTPCPATGVFPTTYTYTMKIDVTQGGQTWTIASALKDGDTPVQLPGALVDGQIATVNATIYKTTCTFGCGTPTVQATESFAIVTYPRGSFAAVTYDRTVFDVGGDQVINDWQAAHFTSLTLSHVPADPSPTFYATAYKLTNNTPSYSPTGVLFSDAFAVYETDGFYDEAASAGDNLGLHDMDHIGGLEWPTLTGHNPSNGGLFEFTASVPRIVRDRVHDCAGSLDVYYYLPYTGGYPYWNVVKGNVDDPTSGYSGDYSYALAFSGPTGGDIYAARGGVVVALHEAEATNDDNPWGLGNWVSVRHEDGTYGFYFHLAQNGVLVNVGDRVYRDWHIGEVGGGRLVFEVGNDTCPDCSAPFSSYQTSKVLYEYTQAVYQAGIWVPGGLVECQVPRVGDQILSTSNTL